MSPLINGPKNTPVLPPCTQVWFTLKSSVYMVNVVFGHDESSASELLIPDDPEKTAQAELFF